MIFFFLYVGEAGRKLFRFANLMISEFLGLINFSIIRVYVNTIVFFF